MSEKPKRDKKKYNYRYIQFIITSSEKKQIEEFLKKENFKTVSDFVRRVIFDYIRRRENPELFLSRESNSIKPLLIEKIVKQMTQIQENQIAILQREDTLEEMREMVSDLHKLAEAKALAKEREIIIQLLGKHNSLSLRQIQEETNLAEEIVFKIISDMNLFKITTAGRFALR